MPALVIAGITVPVLDGGASEQVVRIGTQQRAYAGNLLTAIRAEKREWAIASTLVTQAEANTLRAAVALGAHVACSGDMLGGAVTCSVEVREIPFTGAATTDGTGFLRTLSLTLREV